MSIKEQIFFALYEVNLVQNIHDKPTSYPWITRYKSVPDAAAAFVQKANAITDIEPEGKTFRDTVKGLGFTKQRELFSWLAEN